MDLFSGYEGICRFSETAYKCALPYEGLSTNFALGVSTQGYICDPDAVEGKYIFYGASKEASPYQHDVVIASDAKLCPLVILEPQ